MGGGFKASQLDPEEIVLSESVSKLVAGHFHQGHYLLVGAKMPVGTIRTVFFTSGIVWTVDIRQVQPRSALTFGQTIMNRKSE